MRIRRAASRVLGSAYFTTHSEASRASMSNLPPTSPASTPAAYGGGGDLGGPMVALEGSCQLSLSPWDLPYELEDPNPMEAPFDKYLECIPYRESFMSNSDHDDEMGVEDKIWMQVKNEEVNDQQPDHMVNQGGEMRKMKEKMNESMLVKEMEDIDKQASVWYCNKNDGKKWHCRNIVNGPKTLCDYHLAKSRSYYTRSSETGIAASSKSSQTKASAIAKTAMPKSIAGESSAQNNSIAATSSVSVPTISQPSKRKAGNGLGGDAYYFYDMFIPYRKKDRGGSSNHQVDAEEKEILPQDNAVVIEVKTNNKKQYDDVYNSSNDSLETGSDDESDEDYIVGGASKIHTKKGKMKLSMKKVKFSKMVKKRVKERSIKSLL